MRGLPLFVHLVIFISLLTLFHVNVLEPLADRLGLGHLSAVAAPHDDLSASSKWSPTWVAHSRKLQTDPAGVPLPGERWAQRVRTSGRAWRSFKQSSAGPSSRAADADFDDPASFDIDEDDEEETDPDKMPGKPERSMDRASHWERDANAEVPPDVAAMAVGRMIGQVVDFVVRFAIEFFFAFMYKKHVVDRKQVLNATPPQVQPEGAPASGFKHGICDCFSDLDICLHTFCCWHVRVADTYHGAGVLDFWVTFLVGMICSPCFILCVMPCKRGEIRSKVSGGPSDCRFEDFLLVCCCTACTTCQEARAVDEVLGVRTKCCCQLTAVEDSRVPLVGEVVSVASPQVATVTGVHPAFVLQPPTIAPLHAQPGQAFQFEGREVVAGVVQNPEAAATTESLPQPGQDAEMQPLAA